MQEGCTAIKREFQYRVDGEIGRFEFGVYDIKSQDDKTVFDGSRAFPFRSGVQWYRTCGFKEMALIFS